MGGYDAPPIESESRAAYAAPPRDKFLNRDVRKRGGPNDMNVSNVFSSGKDRGDWVDDLESTHKVDYIAPGWGLRDPKHDEIIADHRANHFELGTDPTAYDTTNTEAFQPRVAPLVKPVKAPAAAVKLGQPDPNWKENLQSTNRAVYTKPLLDEQDSLTDFVKKGPPLKFGDDDRELTTENRSQYKKVGYLDCSKLTDEQLQMLGITREQLIPAKVPLPYLSGHAFKNSLGQPIGLGPVPNGRPVPASALNSSGGYTRGGNPPRTM